VHHISIKHCTCIILILPFSSIAEGPQPQLINSELIPNTDPQESYQNPQQSEEGKNYIIFRILLLRKFRFFRFQDDDDTGRSM
jgi:hypothetical protein